MQEVNLIGIISAGGSLPVLDTLNITENGTYTPPSGVDGYNEVNVAVPTPQPALDTLNITENGTYTPPSGVDGYNEVNVAVPTPQPSFETLNVTENGTYTPPSGVDGYDEVNVNISSSKEVGFNYNYIISNNSGITVKGGSTINSLSTLWDGDYRIDCAIKGQYNITSYNKVILFIGYLGDSYKHRFSGTQDNWNFYLLLTKNIMTSAYLTPSTLISSSESDVYQKIDVTTNYDSALLYYELNIPHNDGARYINLHIPGIALTDVKVSLI